MARFSALTRVVTASVSRAPPSFASSRRIVAAVKPARRFLSSEADAAAKPTPPPPPPPPAPPAAAKKSGGSSFLQRFGAFLMGAGLGSGIGYFHLSKEIKGSTAALEKAIAKNHSVLSDRLDKLEK